MTHACQKLKLLKKRNIFILLIHIVIVFTVKSQDILNYKYYVGVNDPDTNWKTVSFNDMSWLEGYGSIGYGDNDDSTLIDTATSVYIRYTLRFNDDFQSYKGIIIYPDFDDGFIAYLNGIEVLRINVSVTVGNPNYLQTTIRSHEAYGYRETDDNQLYNIQGYYIDSLQLAKCTINAFNILAFAVYNDSINGSDLTFNLRYTVIDNIFYKSTVIRNYIAKPESDSTILPYIIIETDEFGISENSTFASMGIINNSTDKFNSIYNDFTDYNGRIRVKLHGTYSLGFPKKSLRIELQDLVGRNKNVSIIGLPEENDFILYGPYQDKTMIKNLFTYNLWQKMGYYAPRTRFCELVLNGNNLGLYVLIEKIKQDKNRVNITELNSNDNIGTGITGGYILVFNEGLEILYPDSNNITTGQENYINNFINECQELIQQINSCNIINEYRNYIDINSLADYYLINELSLNFDAFSRSWYMYKDNDLVDGRLKFGPLWDYDVAWNYYIGQDVDGWRRLRSPVIDIQYIMRDTAFTHLMINKWNNYRKKILSESAICDLIDSLTTAIAPAIERNCQIWPVIQYDEYGRYEGFTYNDWVDTMKTWIKGRLLWMDENIGDLVSEPYCNFTNNNYDFGNNEFEIVNYYPNPFINELNFNLYFLKPGDIKLSIYDITGIELYFESYRMTEGYNRVKIILDNEIAPGIYNLVITNNNKFVFTKKIIKVH